MPKPKKSKSSKSKKPKIKSKRKELGFGFKAEKILISVPKTNSKPKIRRMKHRSYLKKIILTDQTKPDGVKENPFIIKNRSISNRVNSIIIGIQQPIIQMLNLTKDTWYKQYCDPVTKTITLEVYDKESDK